MDPMQVLDTFRGYIEQGGFVMPPLVLSTFVLWYAMGYRFLTLQRGTRKRTRDLIRLYSEQAPQRRPRGIVDAAVARGVEALQRKGDLRRLLDDAYGELRNEMNRGRVLIKSIVGAAPLAGLLGTVTGMIETFDSLGEMSLFAQSGGIAGGISQALFTTQLGLAVAVPGVVVGRLLDKRQQNFERELDKLEDIFCADLPEGQTVVIR